MTVKKLSIASSVLCGIISVVLVFCLIAAVILLGYCIVALGKGADGVSSSRDLDILGGLFVGAIGFVGAIITGIVIIVSGALSTVNIIAVVMGIRSVKKYNTTSDILSFKKETMYKLITSCLESVPLILSVPNMALSLLNTQNSEAVSDLSSVAALFLLALPFVAVAVISGITLYLIKQQGKVL